VFLVQDMKNASLYWDFSFFRDEFEMRSVLLKTKKNSFFESRSFCSRSLFLDSSGILASSTNMIMSASFIARIAVGQCPIFLLGG